MPSENFIGLFYTKWFLTISLQCLPYLDTEFHLLIRHNWAPFQKDEQSLFCGPIQKLGWVWVTVFVSVCFQALKGWMLQQDNWGSVGQFPTPRSPWKGLSPALEPMLTDYEYKTCTSTPTQHEGSSWPFINYVISHSLAFLLMIWPQTQLRHSVTRTGILSSKTFSGSSLLMCCFWKY